MAPEPITAEAFSRLPKWAQAHIAQLEGNIKTKEQQLEVFHRMHGVTPALVSIGIDKSMFLPDYSALELRNPASKWMGGLRASLDRSSWHREQRIIMHVTSNNGRVLLVRPHAANVVTIEEDKP